MAAACRLLPAGVIPRRLGATVFRATRLVGPVKPAPSSRALMALPIRACSLFRSATILSRSNLGLLCGSGSYPFKLAGIIEGFSQGCYNQAVSLGEVRNDRSSCFRGPRGEWGSGVLYPFSSSSSSLASFKSAVSKPSVKPVFRCCVIAAQRCARFRLKSGTTIKSESIERVLLR